MDAANTLRLTLLDAMMNELYYRHRAHRAAWWDNASRSLTAVLSTGAVVTFASTFSGPAEWIWRSLSLAAAAASVTGPILQLSEKSRKWSELAVAWTTLAGACKVLMLESLDEPKLTRKVTEIVARAEKLQAEDSTRRNDKLVTKLMVDVRRSVPHLIHSSA